MIVLLAPGPSMSQALADSVRGCRVGAVTSALPLAWKQWSLDEIRSGEALAGIVEILRGR